MAKLRPWPAFMIGGGAPLTARHPLASGETFKAGDFVVLNSSEEIEEVDSADETPVYGIANENAADVIEEGYVTVTVFTPNLVIAIQGDNAPVAGDVNQEYGYVEDGDGVYTIDGTDTTNAVLRVLDIDIERELYLCTILAADRYID